MEALFCILVLAILALPLVALGLRRTEAWMVPGVFLMVGAILLFATVPTLDDVDPDSITALGNSLQYAAALIVAFLGLLAFALGGIKRKKPAPVASPLPVARTF